jgi:hypothetical protein
MAKINFTDNNNAQTKTQATKQASKQASKTSTKAKGQPMKYKLEICIQILRQLSANVKNSRYRVCCEIAKYGLYCI